MPAKEKKNAALEALTSGAKAFRTAKKAQPAPVETVEEKVKSSIVKAKLEGGTQLQLAMNRFIDVTLKNIATSFIELYLSSREPGGDAAVLALDACAAAFDECGLVLSDVETKKPAKKKMKSKS